MSFVACVEALLKEDICVLPTETVYGLACSALSKVAVQKVFALKGRPSTNPLIVHIWDHSTAEQVCQTNEYSKKLAEAFWPGPITFILPKKKCIPHLVTAGLNTIAVRSPSHPLFRSVMKAVKLPIAAPSANPTNKISPTRYQNVCDGFQNECPPILDGGLCKHGLESTVIDLTKTVPLILRFGPITRKQIENVLKIPINSKVSYYANDSLKNKGASAPGQGAKHYAPDKDLYLYRSKEQLLKSKQITENDVILLPDSVISNLAIPEMVIKIPLSESGDPSEIAKNLFNSLRLADLSRGEKIHASLFPIENELCLAINDRLIRASTKRF